MAVTRYGMYGGPRADWFGADYSGKTEQVLGGNRPTHRRLRIPRGPFVLFFLLLL